MPDDDRTRYDASALTERRDFLILLSGGAALAGVGMLAGLRRQPDRGDPILLVLDELDRLQLVVSSSSSSSASSSSSLELSSSSSGGGGVVELLELLDRLCASGQPRVASCALACPRWRRSRTRGAPERPARSTLGQLCLTQRTISGNVGRLPYIRMPTR